MILDHKEIHDIVQTIYIQNTFVFNYNVYKKAGVKKENSNPDYNVNKFKDGTKMAIEFQVNFKNFKASKKINSEKYICFAF